MSQPSEQEKHEEARYDVWEDIKAETGFSSYRDYLVKSGRIGVFPDLPSRPTESDLVRPYTCTIIDILRGPDSKPELVGQDIDTYASSSTTKILTALRKPPRTACLRVVLWWKSGGYWRDNDTSMPILMDACGLGLRIGPRFFETLNDHIGETKFTPRQIVRPTQSIQSFRPTSMVLGNQIATVLRNYVVDQAECPPTLLIVGWDESNWEDYTIDDEPNGPSDRDWDWTFNDVQPFQSPVSHQSPVREDSDSIQSLCFRSRTYCKILDHLLEQVGSTMTDQEQLLILSTLPMMHLDTLEMRAKIRSLRQLLRRRSDKQWVGENLKSQRFDLRRHVEDTTTNRKSFIRYAVSQGGGEVLSHQAYYMIQELWDDTISEARLLEAEIRDKLQLQSSDLSLQESRRSIELSNYQIEEGSRVKIFTILALVYVPLNTVTSVYGMNVQQINGSGHNIWVFVVTSVCALLITGILWYILEEVNRIRQFRSKRFEGHDFEAPNYSLPFRFYLICWLLKAGHAKWMWNTGALRGILRNRGYFAPAAMYGNHMYRGGDVNTACDYVAYFMDSSRDAALFAFGKFTPPMEARPRSSFSA